MRHPRFMALAGVMVAVLCLQGCLDADRVTALSYDARTDTFTLLRVYYNIHGDQEADVKNLLALYANRDHILPAEAWPLLSENAVIRVEGGVREVDLGKATMGPVIKPPVDLSTLENKPGAFFTSDEGMLCYYHQLVIPGAVLDKMLAWAQQQAQAGLAKEAADEQATRKNGAGRQTWAHERRMVRDGIKGIPNDQREQQGPGETFLLSALSDDSVQLLADVAKNGGFTLTRKAGVIHATAKLTPEDATEIKATVTALRAELQNKIEGGADPAKESDLAAAMIVDALDITVLPDGTVDAAADVARIGPLIARLQAAGITKPDAGKTKDYTRMVEGVKDAKAAMEGPMSAARVVEKFTKGELKLNLPETSVKVGEGLGESGK